MKVLLCMSLLQDDGKQVNRLELGDLMCEKFGITHKQAFELLVKAEREGAVEL